jgi:hypothetical protein
MSEFLRTHHTTNLDRTPVSFLLDRRVPWSGRPQMGRLFLTVTQPVTLSISASENENKTIT